MRWGLTSNVRTLMIAAPAREIVSKVSCEPLYRPAEVQCPLRVGSGRQYQYKLAPSECRLSAAVSTDRRNTLS